MLLGDADLYISSDIEQPTYLFQDHGLREVIHTLFYKLNSSQFTTL